MVSFNTELHTVRANKFLQVLEKPIYLAQKGHSVTGSDCMRSLRFQIEK